MTNMRGWLALPLVMVLAACGSEGGEDANTVTAANQMGSAGGAGARSSTIGDAIAASADASGFHQAVESAGLGETLRGGVPYTVFVPANEAFAALAPPAGGQQAVGLLSGHIVPGTVTAEDMRRAAERGEGGRAELATVAGHTLSISREGDTLVITDGAGGQARVTAPDQIHSNGVVHRIDRVLAPPQGPGGEAPTP